MSDFIKVTKITLIPTKDTSERIKNEISDHLNSDDVDEETGLTWSQKVNFGLADESQIPKNNYFTIGFDYNEDFEEKISFFYVRPIDIETFETGYNGNKITLYSGREYIIKENFEDLKI